MKKAVVLGAGGFIGAHLVTRLVREGYHVRAGDRFRPAFAPSPAHEFLIGDLRDLEFCRALIRDADERVFQLAADMGGAQFIFSGDNDAEILHNSALINLNALQACRERRVRRVFYSSSACIYPAHNQNDPRSPDLAEATAYPAAPDSEYGWEKLFSERLYQAHARNHGIEVRIARYHNVFGPEGTWTGGREKVPAALCRKIAAAPDGGEIEIWGDGEQTRSFLYVDECVEGTLRLMDSEFAGPVNLGSEEMITINELAMRIMRLAGKQLRIRHVPGPEGVRGRRSDNRLILDRLDWAPSWPLDKGLEITYAWISARAAASIEAQQRELA